MLDVRGDICPLGSRGADEALAREFCDTVVTPLVHNHQNAVLPRAEARPE